MIDDGKRRCNFNHILVGFMSRWCKQYWIIIKIFDVMILAGKCCIYGVTICRLICCIFIRKHFLLSTALAHYESYLCCLCYMNIIKVCKFEKNSNSYAWSYTWWNWAWCIDISQIVGLSAICFLLITYSVNTF